MEAKNIYLYGPNRLKQGKVVILDELADIKLYELSAKSFFSRPEANTHFSSRS
jgi:hypothetical protein